MKSSKPNIGVWVIDQEVNASCLERLGDARRIADTLQTEVGVLLIDPRQTVSGEKIAGSSPETSGIDISSTLIHRGADLILQASAGHHERLTANQGDVQERLATISKVDTTIRALEPFQVQVVLAGGDPAAREWAALLAAKTDWKFISPALMVEYRRNRLVVTQIDPSGRRSCQMEVDDGQTTVVTFRSGVAEAVIADESRQGHSEVVTLVGEENRTPSQIIPADPTAGDIRHAKRLVAGGRGLGSSDGFDLLREVGEVLGAGVAASRMAVDLGWIEYERQVGQTGKSVEPELYIACGISGASHHVQGLAGAKHIIAINTDADAAIMKVANLGLVADLYPVLEEVRRKLAQKEPQVP